MHVACMSIPEETIMHVFKTSRGSTLISRVR